MSAAVVGGAGEQAAEEAEAAEVCYFLASVNRPGVTGQSAASAGGSMGDGGGGGGGGGRVRGKKGAAGEIGISGGDSWLTRAGWCKAERTLTLSLMDPGAPPDEHGAVPAHPDEGLREPVLLHLYLPPPAAAMAAAHGMQPPFCYAAADAPAAVAAMVQDVNDGLPALLQQPQQQQPQQQPQLAPGAGGASGGCSLLRVGGLVSRLARAHRAAIWGRPAPSAGGEARLARRRAVEARVAAGVREASASGVDALLSLLSASLATLRRSSVANPFPPFLVRRAAGGGGEGLGGGREKQFEELVATLCAIPPAATLLSAGSGGGGGGGSSAAEIPRSLHELPTTALQLLQWALTALPARLTPVRNQTPADAASLAPLLRYRRGDPACPDVVLSVSLGDDAEFERLAALHGTCLAFHGSPAENFHSILHNGLRNMSGTRFESTGAAFGDGIYLAQDLTVARSFAMGRTLPWKGSDLFGPRGGAAQAAAAAAAEADSHGGGAAAAAAQPKQPTRLSCVIACEVIDHPQNVLRAGSSSTSDGAPARRRQRNRGGGGGDGGGEGAPADAYFVVPDETHVRAKYLLLYDDTPVAGQPRMMRLLLFFALLVAATAVLGPMLFDQSR
jgi:poly[ADP-ribose] polymerase 16